MRGHSIILLGLSAVMVCVCQVQAAQPRTSMGLGIGTSQSEYQDYDNDVLPLPMINYESQRYYFHGMSGGVYVQNNEVAQLTFGASLFFQQFDPSDTGDAALRLLDKRKYTLLMEMGYKRKLLFGQVSTSLGIDALDRSDSGLFGLAEYQYPLPLTERLSIVPALGGEWRSADFNQYYYGVSSTEATRTGIGRYSPDSSVTPHVALLVNYQLSDTMNINLATKYQWLPSEITDSPMVDRSHKLSTFLSMNYMF